MRQDIKVEIRGIVSKKSSEATEIDLMTALSSTYARIPEKKQAKSLTSGRTFFVRSSTKPDIKAGRLQSSINSKRVPLA